MSDDPQSTTDAIIVAQEVHKTFRTGKIEVHALRGIDLTVGRGEMVAVMGPSGCGKTTLLNCLSGLDYFDRGEIIIEGANLRQMGDRRRTAYRAQRMGFVFQTYNLLPVISAVENVELPLLVSGVKPADARQRARWPRSTRLVSVTAPIIDPPSFPAASANASPLPAPWSTNRPSSGPTNRPATWTANRPKT